MRDFWVEMKEGLLIALRAIRSNTGRATLTRLASIIAFTSVVLMTTAIKGID